MGTIFLYVALAALVLIAMLFIIASFFFRTVVPTNMVHIVQYRKKSVSYGTGEAAGNVYYRWPSWLPFIGVSYIPLPVSNFNLNLKDYEAYDKDRLPFILDATAFFRINDTNIAAQRISSKAELDQQLTSILQGAIRKILASHDINTVMTDRSTFGEQFTHEVEGELKNWGVEPVKNIELMDIRDAKGSTVISDIMAKKSSQINMESRVEVANNNKKAQLVEITAKQEVDVQDQASAEAVGKRTAEKEQVIGISEQQAQQKIKEEEAETVRKEKEVEKVRIVRDAEIKKEAAVVEANQEKEVTVRRAEGRLESAKLDAQGIEATGQAEGAAEKAKQMAQIEPQITLATAIAEKPEYQNYLVMTKFAEVYMSVGGKQAEALKEADIKIIATGGSAQAGLKSAADLFSANGGFAIGSMLEALESTPQGAEILQGVKKFLDKGKEDSPVKK